MIKTHVKEARRLEMNPKEFYRHDKPRHNRSVLRPGNMGDTEA